MQDTSFDSFPDVAQTGFKLDCVYDVVCPDFSQYPTDPEYTETELSQYLDTFTRWAEFSEKECGIPAIELPSNTFTGAHPTNTFLMPSRLARFKDGRFISEDYGLKGETMDADITTFFESLCSLQHLMIGSTEQLDSHTDQECSDETSEIGGQRASREFLRLASTIGSILAEKNLDVTTRRE